MCPEFNVMLSVVSKYHYLSGVQWDNRQLHSCTPGTVAIDLIDINMYKLQLNSGQLLFVKLTVKEFDTRKPRGVFTCPVSLMYIYTVNFLNNSTSKVYRLLKNFAPTPHSEDSRRIFLTAFIFSTYREAQLTGSSLNLFVFISFHITEPCDNSSFVNTSAAFSLPGIQPVRLSSPFS